jgi:hypothetical protein
MFITEIGSEQGRNSLSFQTGNQIDLTLKVNANRYRVLRLPLTKQDSRKVLGTIPLPAD